MEKNLPKRSEVPKELTWDLTAIYKDETEWEKSVNESIEIANKIAEYEGRVVESAATLLEIMKLYEKCSTIMGRYMPYAMFLHDEDTADAKNQEISGKADMAAVKISEKIAFLEPEILDLDSEKLKGYYEEEKGLLKYKNHIDNIIRVKDHMLDKNTEKLLASAADMAGAFSNSYGMLMDADMKYPSVKDHEGQEISITGGRFVPLQMSEDRELRKESFEKFYGRLKEFRNTSASIYEGHIKQLIFFAKARKYDSTFEAAVDAVNVSASVCDNLIDSVHRNMDKMHRYVSLRKKLLGLDELHMYDVYAPMVSDSKMEISFEEAKETALKALAPLGDDYVRRLKEAFSNRWIDVLENEGKRGGAYSCGIHDVHPFVLLNYNKTLDNMFTLVHEMGHAMHSALSSENQSFLDAQYKIFVAEVASTTNEVLLLEYLLKNTEDKKEKAVLINHYLESFKSTLYRQTMFEEFERKTNKMAEDGIPLTAEKLEDTYLNLNKEYFGDDMVSDELIAHEWSRIPHFYYNFYVYQYATSFAAAVAIAHRILAGEKDALENYLTFLSSGCTKDPVSLLKIAGVDMSTAKPVDEALKVFDEQIDKMFKLMED